MKRPALYLSLLFCALISQSVKAQNPEAYYRAVVAAVSGDSINKNLLSFEQLGIKEENTASIENTRLWLAQKYLGYSYAPYYDTFIYLGDTLYNVIADKKGNVDSNSWVIVCGHYDTEGGPGVNDNGSGVASILEIARLLQNIPTYYSVRFINFAGEEDGFKGSIHYVTTKAVPSNMQIRVVFNIDEIGAIAGLTNTMVTCERDEGGQTANNAASWHFTNILDTLMKRYGELDTKIAAAFLSDYIPFELNGFVITGLYETNVTPFRHTINDSLSKLDTQYVRKVTKGALAATMNYAGVTDVGKSVKTLKNLQFLIYPNPAQDLLFIKPFKPGIYMIELIDQYGRLLRREELNASQPLLVHDLQPGIFYYRLLSHEGGTIQTGSFIKR